MRARAISSAQAMRRGPVIYPFVFAVSPILFVWAQNVEEFSLFAGPADFFVPASLSVGFTVLAIGLGSLILRNARKAALIVFLFLLAFYFYGHVYDLLLNAEIGVPRQRYFLLAWAAVFTVAGLLALRIRADLRGLTNTLNLVVGLLAIISLFDIAVYHLGSGTDLANNQIGETADFAAPGLDPSDLPDIYYIITDAYTNSRNLKGLGYDNSPFTDYLTSKGFFVASESSPNYSHTGSSLASSLNMQHLDYLAGVMPDGSMDGTVYAKMIRENKVMGLLRAQGYKVVHTREGWMSGKYDDQHLSCLGSTLTSFHADDFSGALIHTTALEPVLRLFNLVESRLQAMRLCDFSMIVEAKTIPGPKLVFAHLFVPHPPYIFGRNGEQVSANFETTDYGAEDQYVDQVVFVNKKLQEVVDALLSGPGNPPVIVIQGDHGTAFAGDDFTESVYKERMRIFNAYHLPDGGNDLLYESVTPVNTFRIIFNRYFGADYELLDDTSWYTNLHVGRFNYLDVTDLVR